MTAPSGPAAPDPAALLALARPIAESVAAGLVLGGVLRVLGVLCVVGWIGFAAVSLVRGR